ncbi:hypothetical protein GCM10017710_05820 [Arthrobacter ramosus]
MARKTARRMSAGAAITGPMSEWDESRLRRRAGGAVRSAWDRIRRVITLPSTVTVRGRRAYPAR